MLAETIGPLWTRPGREDEGLKVVLFQLCSDEEPSVSE